MTPPQIAVLIAPGPNPEIVINALKGDFPNLVVIEEQPESKKVFFGRRAKKLGRIAVAGQFATVFASRLLKRFSRARRRPAEILKEFGADDAVDPALRRISVPSANSPELLRAISDVRPAALLLVSCRMLKPETLAGISCPVLNFHAGINPRYRGLHGGYWSRVMDDEKNFGGTVHLVDAGVDTGAVLYQHRLRPSGDDMLLTYPLLLTAASTPIVVRAVHDAVRGDLKPLETGDVSRQWYHPPVWTWLWNGLTRGIW